MIFQTHVTVPDIVITKLAMEIKEKFLEELERNERFEYLKKDMRMYDLAQKYNQIVNEYVEESVPSYNGYSLEIQVVKEIADLLRNQRKINAIKEFRAATGAGLKDAKYLIDEFGTGNDAADQFMIAFT